MKIIKDLINIFRLKTSKYFNKKYYKLENPDVKGDCAEHYYYLGYKEGRNPSKYFDNDYYLYKHKDVREADINPLIHYLKKGKKEKRKIKNFNGINIDRLYYKLYNEVYSVNVHLVNKEKKVNFIVNKLDKDSLNIIKKLKNNYCFDRLFYFSGDKTLLKEIGKDIVCEKISKDYYLNISINDFNICFDKHSLIAFNNNNYINNLYMYIRNIDDFDKKFINYISYYGKIGRLKLISSNNLKLCEPLFFDIPSIDNNIINFNFKDHLFLGLELLNKYVLNNNLTNIKEMYYESDKYHYSINLERDIILSYKKFHETKCNKVIFDSDGIYLDDILIIKFKSENYLKTYKIENILNKSK